jgi:serine protease Do
MKRFSAAIIFGMMVLGATSGTISSLAGDTPGLALARELNDAFVQVADKVTPAVVIVEVKEKPTVGRRGFARQQQGEGSGIIITADGYILTNNHVVDNAATNGITVVLKDGQEFPAVVVGTDAKSDIAVIKINTKGAKLTTAKLGDSSKLRVGEFVVAIGHPLDLTFSVTVGHVSALHREVPDEAEQAAGGPPLPEYIQTDAVINPGNSGGPLLNLDGEVIGINDMIEAYTDRFTGGTVNVGIGLAIPVNEAKAVKDVLMSRGKFVRSRIGIVMGKSEVPELQPASLKPGADRPRGVSVLDLTSGGPAAHSGLKIGDLIVAVDNVPVTNTRELYDEVSFKPPGQTVSVSVLRIDKPLSIKVTTEAVPEEEVAATPTLRPTPNIAEMNYGFSVTNLTKDLANKFNLTETSGVVVTSVLRGSPAYGWNIVAGDIITKLNSKPVTNAKDFLKAIEAIKPGASLTMELGVRGGKGEPPFIVLHAPNQ